MRVDGTWDISSPAERKLTAAEYRAARLAIGDLVMTKSSGSELHLGKTAIVTPEVASLNCCFSNFMQRLRGDKTAEPKFLYYVLNCPVGREQLNYLGSTTTGLANLNGTVIGSLIVPCPSPSEQRAIAAFLDRETTKIDALIVKKVRQIELLREKQKALVDYAVTKGLDPSAPTRNSGVEWVGNLPSHWQTKRIRDVSLSLQTGPFGSQLHSGDYIPDGVPVINPSHMKNGHIYPDRECAIDDHTWSRLAQHRLHQGDIVFARRGELGRCALVTSQEEGWLCGTGSLRMRPNQNVVDPLYLNWLFSTRGIGEWLSLESVGATMENLNTSILGRVPLPVPPIDEQRVIAAFLDRQTTMVSDLITRVAKHIDKLREHRKALISAAVTGKIDVREGTV